MKSIGMPAIAGGSGGVPVAAETDVASNPTKSATRVLTSRRRIAHVVDRRVCIAGRAGVAIVVRPVGEPAIDSEAYAARRFLVTRIVTVCEKRAWRRRVRG